MGNVKSKPMTVEQLMWLNDVLNKYKRLKGVVDGSRKRRNKKLPAFSKFEVWPSHDVEFHLNQYDVSVSGYIFAMDYLSVESKARISNFIEKELKREAASLEEILRQHSVDV